MDITVNDFYKAMACIRQQIGRDETTFDYVVGISRGGLVPGVFLSHRLKIPFRPIEWSLRDSNTRSIPPDIRMDIYRGKKILLVDDIVDSGETILTILNKIGTDFRPNIKVACLVYNKAQNLITPDFWYNVIDRGDYPDWVNFWWEKDLDGHI